MAYIGKSIESGTFSVLDTSGNTYNGSNTTFNLGTQVGSVAQLLVSHDGVIQKPGTDYTLASGGTQITFTTAPASGASIFIVEISGAVGGPLDSDLNGTELILDADGDTSLHASTDDQIDIKIAGADDFKFSANAMNVLSGSTLTIDSGATITNNGTANNFGTTTIGGLTDVTMDATNFVDSIVIQTDSDGSAPTTGTLSSATGNIGIGKDVFASLTSGTKNVVFGYNAGDAIQSSDECVVIGSEAGTDLTTGNNNVFIGRGAGASITTGASNLAIGHNALDNCDAEQKNVAVGQNALGGAIAGGELNVAVGVDAGLVVTSGDENTLIGYQAGSGVTTGANNTLIGRNAGAGDLVTGSNNICIGSGSDVAAGDQSNGIALGPVDAAGGDFTFGNRVLGTVTCDYDTDANFSHSSDERLKKNIKSSTIGLDFINELRPITYQWKPNNEIPTDMMGYAETNVKDTEKVIHGFIAQEVKEAIDKYGDENFSGWELDKADGKTQRIKKEMFIMPIVKAIQELSARVKELEDR
jgi:trimeric autotransporter adhesin